MPNEGLLKHRDQLVVNYRRLEYRKLPSARVNDSSHLANRTRESDKWPAMRLEAFHCPGYPCNTSGIVFAGDSSLLLRFPMLKEGLEVFKRHVPGAFKLAVFLGIEKLAVAVEDGQG